MDDLWCFEVILLPSRVIERSYVQTKSVDRDLAREMFAVRYERGDYPSGYSPHTGCHPLLGSERDRAAEIHGG